MLFSSIFLFSFWYPPSITRVSVPYGTCTSTVLSIFVVDVDVVFVVVVWGHSEKERKKEKNKDRREQEREHRDTVLRKTRHTQDETR
mmetsp:Transcript_49577/g.50384  ORF Transcript_49577/g.50384 Transcript_49577/m.50384 type:complete len:87 (+) Transcript_49577:1-261(+)